MSKQLSRTTVARSYRLTPYNTIAFPRELREAIPDLPTCVGRVLKLDSVNGKASNTDLYGRRIHLSLVVRETGRLKGRFVVRMDLLPEAARTLAATLTRLVGEVEPRGGEAE
ncbi:MAG: hypothetical protein ABSC05_25465 [Candidatus Solibacter sp.]|jgi:hypothetical protein